jgi:hypothetical protein
MAQYRLEQDRGYGWQIAAEAEIPDATTMEQIKVDAMQVANRGPVRAYLDGVLVFEHAKLTRKQAKALGVYA